MCGISKGEVGGISKGEVGGRGILKGEVGVGAFENGLKLLSSFLDGS